MPWRKLEYQAPPKQEVRALTGKAKFYSDQNVDDTIVLVLRRLGDTNGEDVWIWKD
jgi:hypothetical protein